MPPSTLSLEAAPLASIASSFPASSRVAVYNTHTQRELTLVTSRACSKGNILAYYPMTALRTEQAPQTAYLMELCHPSGRKMSHLVGDMDWSRSMLLHRGIPQVAHLANEASTFAQVNSEFYIDLPSIYRSRLKLQPGDLVLYSLRATCSIPEGTEVLTDYGPGYAGVRTWTTELHP